MSMMDSDFDAWFGTLSPGDQQFVLQQLGLYDANAVGGGFDGAFSPSLDAQSLDLAGFGAAYPQDFNTKGEPLPFGLDQAGQLLTQQKNRNALIADNITGAMAGPGAYDPRAFQPTYEFSGPVVETPGRTMASYYAGMGGGGFQSLIADAILNGDDPSTAVAKAISLASLPDSDSLTPEMRAQRDALVASLQPARAGSGMQVPSSGNDLTDTQKFAQQYDVGALYDFANDLGAKIAMDPSGAGYTDPTTGTVYQNAPTEVWSGAAQKYMDLGLPFPTARYTDAEYGSPLEDQDRLLALYQAEDESRAAQAAAPTARTTNDMEQVLAQYQRELSQRNDYGVPAGQVLPNAQNGERALGPVSRDLYGNLEPVRNDAGRSFRPLVGMTNPQLEAGPSMWQTSGGLQMGDASNAVNQALGRFDFGNIASAALAQAGAPGTRLTDETVTKAKGKQDAARKAISKRIDLNQRGAGERDAAYGLGQQLAMDAQGRTPLKDAMMQRLLANRAQGLYPGY